MKMVKYSLAAALALSTINSVHAAPPVAEPVDVTVVNGAGNPVPVAVVLTAPEQTVVCHVQSGGTSSITEFAPGHRWFILESFICPAGITQINVQRIAVSPDLQVTAEAISRTDNVASWRTVVGVSSNDTSFPPLGYLASLTSSVPEAQVAQNFELDTTDGSRFIYMRYDATSNIAGVEVDFFPTLIFIGTPIAP